MALDDVREPRHGCRRCPIRVSTSFGDLGGSADDDVASSSNHVIAKQAKKSKSRFHRNVKRAVKGFPEKVFLDPSDINA